MGFYHTYILNFHIDEKPLYDLTKDITLFKWLPKHEKIFTYLKQRFCQDKFLTKKELLCSLILIITKTPLLSSGESITLKNLTVH